MKNHKNLFVIMTVILLAVFSLVFFNGCTKKNNESSSSTSTTTGTDPTEVNNVSDAGDDEDYGGDSSDESGITKDYFADNEKSDEQYKKDINAGAKSIINAWMKKYDFGNARALVAGYPDMCLKIGKKHILRYSGVDFIGFDPADEYHLWYREAKKKEVKTDELTAEFASNLYFSDKSMDKYTLEEFVYTLGEEEIEAFNNVKEKFRR